MSLAYNTQTEAPTDWEVLEAAITSHPAWFGKLNGMKTEEILRDRPPFSYLLREGEERHHYYLSFVIEPPCTYKHQPFRIAFSKNQWEYQNVTLRNSVHLDEIIGMIMHCHPSKGIPILQAAIA